MRRQRLRQAHGPAELAAMYAAPFNHKLWPDHVHRVNATIAAALTLTGLKTVATAADLSCGDGAILRAIPAERKIFADLTSSRPLDLVGPIERTIEQIPLVDLFVCTETLEHLDNPDRVLADIGATTKLLLLSTPLGAWEDDNAEHYWAWDAQAVEAMLSAAGFEVLGFDVLPMWYHFGIWTAQTCWTTA